MDDDAHTRALYAPHPVLSGLVSRAGLLRTILLVNAIDALRVRMGSSVSLARILPKT